jgi:hypothetical protein
MDLYDANEKIKNIKYPYIFLFRLLTFKSDITDYNFSLILRLYLKNHIDSDLFTNLKIILSDDIADFKISSLIIENFYKFTNAKVILLMTIKKWYNIYNNDVFWKLNVNDKIDFLYNLKFKFLAIYDCSKGGVPFYMKLNSLYKNNNPSRLIILDNIKERLLLILNLFNIDIFNSLNIPLIKLSEFYNLDSKYLIEYLMLIFKKIIKLLNDTILLFENYNIICNYINNLLNPRQINIIESNDIANDYSINDIIKY